MRIKVVWVGRTKSEPIRVLIEDYLRRFMKFARCEVTEVRESAAREAERIKEEEAERILGALRPDANVILLDVDGQQWSSPELARQVEEWQNASVKEIAFVIGGHLGVASSVRTRSTVCWSLSRLTLTHEMARVLLLEQLYRAYTIVHGVPYQN